MFMSVHNTINVGKVIYKRKAPILLLPVSNCLVFWPCQHLLLGKCEIMLVRLVCPRPLLFCSVALDASKQKRVVHMVRIILAWLVECGRYREYLDNNPGRPKMEASDREDGCLVLIEPTPAVDFLLKCCNFGVGRHCTSQRLSQFLLVWLLQ
jgi:hypothetical protein